MNYLVIPDLQIPFEHEHALAHCKAVAKEYKVPKENILCVGDEVDFYFGSQYPKDADADMSARSELKTIQDKVKHWGKAFPEMRLAVSNHGLRWVKKATQSGLPSQLIRHHSEIIGAPDGWKWEWEWKIDCKHPFLMKHGLEYGGKTPYRVAPLAEGMSVVFGHHHTTTGIAFVRTTGFSAWGMNVGALIDEESFAFSYSKTSLYKVTGGCGVIIDDGRKPLFIPI